MILLSCKLISLSLSFCVLGEHYQDNFGNLRILDPMEDDEGTYKCVVINTVGRATHNIVLTILSKSRNSNFICP